MAKTLEIEDLVELRRLVSNSDSIELKLTVPQKAQRATNRALGLDPMDAQIRQVFFFDTPDLDLNAAGVVARARRIQGRAHDSVIKLRPVVPDTMPAELRRDPGFTIEVDEDLLAHYKHLIGIRNRHEALRVGAYRTLMADEGGSLFAFERTHGNERVVVALNSSESASEVVLPEMAASCYRDLLTDEVYRSDGGFVTVSLPHKWGVVFTACAEE